MCILARMRTTEHLSHDRVLADRARYVSGGVSTPRLVVAGADGARVTDVDGRVFVDFAGGIGCQNTGHRFAPVIPLAQVRGRRGGWLRSDRDGAWPGSAARPGQPPFSPVSRRRCGATHTHTSMGSGH